MNIELRIVNVCQVMFYTKHGVQPIKIENGYNDRIVFVYNKEDTLEVWKLWRTKCIEYKNSNKSRTMFEEIR